MKIARLSERKAISPIIATVLIIAATLIAFAAIGGYMFGILGSGTATANVSVTSVQFSVLNTLAGKQGIVILSNSGTASVNTLTTGAVSLTYGGASCTLTIATAFAVPAGSSSGQIFTSAVTTAGQYCGSTQAVAGEAYTGSVGLANGAVVSFTGTFTS